MVKTGFFSLFFLECLIVYILIPGSLSSILSMRHTIL